MDSRRSPSQGLTQKASVMCSSSSSDDGEAEGDGVIPVGCAHLPGALQLTLDGVLHSINEAGTTLPTERWYGSEKVVDRWLEPTLAELKKVEAS